MTAILFLAPGAFPQTAPLTARDYYNELYKAGGLDRGADAYVCFYEDEKNPNFFIFGFSKDLREYIITQGGFSKLTKEQQDFLKKDFLMVRGYAKGIPFADQQYLNKDGDSWVSDNRKLDKEGKFLRDRLTVNWQTLRFKRSIETFHADSTFMGELPNFGKCEPVAPDIQQHAD
jgi:hypothetical protein